MKKEHTCTHSKMWKLHWHSTFRLTHYRISLSLIFLKTINKSFRKFSVSLQSNLHYDQCLVTNSNGIGMHITIGTFYPTTIWSTKRFISYKNKRKQQQTVFVTVTVVNDVQFSVSLNH